MCAMSEGGGTALAWERCQSYPAKCKCPFKTEGAAIPQSHYHPWDSEGSRSLLSVPDCDAGSLHGFLVYVRSIIPPVTQSPRAARPFPCGTIGCFVPPSGPVRVLGCLCDNCILATRGLCHAGTTAESSCSAVGRWGDPFSCGCREHICATLPRRLYDRWPEPEFSGREMFRLVYRTRESTVKRASG